MIGSTSLFMLQESNNVISTLEESLPEFFDEYEYNYMSIR